jgi:hypothetical protein
MKLTNLIWVLALAGAAAACNSGPPIQCNERNETVNVNTGRCELGAGGTGGSGGTAGTGGTGGTAEGACTTSENQAVYAELEYTDGDGNTTTGTDAGSAIASDCVFGSDNSVPPEGCGAEAAIIIACFLRGDCTQEQIDTLADCVEECTQDTIESVTGSRLTTDCSGCYGATVACGAANCTNVCSNPNAQACVECRCNAGCTPDFVVCSGIPSDDC